MSMVLGSWLRAAATPLERTLALSGGLLLFFATTMTDRSSLQQSRCT
jgi:hypothetical protein